MAARPLAHLTCTMLPAVLSDSSSVATVVIFFVRLVPPLPSRPPSQVKAKPSPVLSWLTCLSDNGKLLDLPKGHDCFHWAKHKDRFDTIPTWKIISSY